MIMVVVDDTAHPVSCFLQTRDPAKSHRKRYALVRSDLISNCSLALSYSHSTVIWGGAKNNHVAMETDEE